MTVPINPPGTSAAPATNNLGNHSHDTAVGRERDRCRVDPRTLGVAFAIHTGFLTLMWMFNTIPLWIAATVGTVLLTWYGSLQHETIHGHPTSSRRVNSLLGWLPLSLWIPYSIYRETHLRHHRHEGQHLTEAGRDPESFYMARATVAGMGVVRRAIHRANCTLVGRVVLGPAVAMIGLWYCEAAKIRSGNSRRLVIWSRHAAGVTLILWYVVDVCHIPLAEYLGLIVYPSVALSLLRSFAEHRADPNPRKRTRVVEAGGLWSLIFLNNNLHIAHHAYPNVPWHELPRVWRRMRASAADPDLVISGGYREVVCRFLFRPIISVECTVRASGADDARGS